MRIIYKLIGSYVCIATVIGLLGWHVHCTGRLIQQHLNAVKQLAVVGIVDAGTMNEALLGAHSIIYRHLADRSVAGSGDDGDRNTDGLSRPLDQNQLNRHFQSFQWSLDRSRQTSWRSREATSQVGLEAILSELQDEFKVHRRLVTETLAQMQDDPGEARLFFEQRVDAHYREVVLPAILAYRERAEKEFSLHSHGIEEELSANQLRTTWLSIGAVLVSVAAGLWISRQLVLPLRKLETAAQRIGKGDFRAGVSIATRDELGTLATAFNQMQDELQQTMVSRNHLKKSLAEKEILLREIHHRVKNNLQIISSLLRLQAAEAGEPALDRFLTESQNRVQAMARIHEQLHQSDDLGKIDISSYVRELGENLTRSHAVDSANVKLAFDVHPVRLPLDVAIPCGLILNELICNALRHAFPETAARSEVTVIYVAGAQQHALGVRDNGRGVADVDWQQEASLGWKLVRALATQLNGELKVVTNGGTSIMVEFPAELAGGGHE